MTEKETDFIKPEQEKEPAFDGIVVLGRGVEKVRTSGGEKWQPTRAIEKLRDQQHSGRRGGDITLWDDDESMTIAGSNANIIAALELFQKLQNQGMAPAVIFSSGRPFYLENDPDKTLSEGKIMAEKFSQKTSANTKIKKPEIVTFGEGGKSTQEDIVNVLRVVQEKGLKSLIFVTIGLHTERAREFYRLAIKDNPQLQDVKTEFVATEKLLEERYARSPSASKMFFGGLETLQKSPAWKHTERREKDGIEALRTGKYKTFQDKKK